MKGAVAYQWVKYTTAAERAYKCSGTLYVEAGSSETDYVINVRRYHRSTGEDHFPTRAQVAPALIIRSSASFSFDKAYACKRLWLSQ